MFSNVVIAFVNKTSIVKVNGVIVLPRVIGNIRALCIVLQVLFTFFGFGSIFRFLLCSSKDSLYMNFYRQNFTGDPNFEDRFSPREGPELSLLKIVFEVEAAIVCLPDD